MNLLSLSLSGNINDLFTEKPVEKLIVGLYKISDTLNLFNTPPYYLAQTDETETEQSPSRSFLIACPLFGVIEVKGERERDRKRK